MNYKLTVTETNNKAGKYHYQVIDENGLVISERKSNRIYVACTISGAYYFGRIDLIGKGDHGRDLNYSKKMMMISDDEFNKTFTNGTSYKNAQDCRDSHKRSIENKSQIAYK